MITIYSILVIQQTKKEFFDYTSEEILQIGQIVYIPFGFKKVPGCVWGPSLNTYTGIKKSIQMITNIVLPDRVLKFIEFFHQHNLCKKQHILKKIINHMCKNYKDIGAFFKKSNTCLKLSLLQQKIYTNIAKSYDNNKISLIFGITGSGKTEIYLKLIQDVINNKGQVLFLLPEIGIIDHIRERIVSQLNITPILWFSGVKTVNGWAKVFRGDNVLVLAARSGIFLPFQNLKLIIVDEEHDTSYKEHNSIPYHSKDMSILLGEIWHIPVILGSATPSIESYYYAVNKKYDLYTLKQRYGIAVLPTVEFIQENKSIIHKYCIEQIKTTIQKGQQVLIYLNKRGFASILECIHCHKKQMCTQCDHILVLHNIKKCLECHLCKKKYITNTCVYCGSQGLLVHGYGVERLEQFFKKQFPNYNIGVFSSDFCNSPTKIKEFIEKIKNNTYQLIIGTQITAKGHNFPNLALVLIINTFLQTGDFRSKEILLQNLLQVAGRAGRERDKSLVLIQSNDQYLQQWLKEENYENFLQYSIKERELWQLPPFYKLIMIKCQHSNEQKLSHLINIIYQDIKETIIKNHFNIEVFPPSNNPIQKIKNQYRMFILLKTQKSSFFFLLQLMEKYTHYQIDINPYDFY